MKKFCSKYTCMWGGLVLVALVLAWGFSFYIGNRVESGRLAELHEGLKKDIFNIQVETLSGRAMGAAMMLGITDELVKEVAQGKLPPDDPQVLAKLRIPREEYAALTTFVMSPEGEIVAYETLRTKKSTGKKVAWRPYFQQAMKGIASVYAGVGSSSGERGVYFAAPIYEQASRRSTIIGAVAMKMAATHIDELLANFPGPALLMSPQDIVYATNRPEFIFHSGAPLSADALQRVKEIRQFGHVFSDTAPQVLPFDLKADEVTIDGVEYAVFRARIDWHDPHGGWTLAVLSDKTGWFPASYAWLVRILVFVQVMLLGGFFYYRLRHQQQKLEQDRMKEQEQQRLRDITDTFPGVVYQYQQDDDKGSFSFVSNGIDELMGISAEELTADFNAFFRNVALVDRLRLQQTMHRPGSDLSLWSDDFQIEKGDGQHCWVYGKAVCHLDEQGQPVWYGYWVDMTERRQMEDDLLDAKDMADKASAAKGKFLASMSHEIRTPMNAIVGFSNLVLETELTYQQRDFLSKLNSSAHLLLGIINDILDFSKIESGKLELEEIDFELSEILDRLAGVMSVAAANKKIELLFDVDPDVPLSLKGDPLRLSQVLLNLLSNSVKFTKEGEVVVSVAVGHWSDGSVQLNFSVRDTGIGLSAGQAEKIFSDFSQADVSTSRSYGGTGLGLAICKNLVALMNGEIGVASEEGKGADFWFTASFAVHRQTVLTQDGLQGKRVLVVDDNNAAREIIARQLRSLDCRVGTVSSGRKAIAALNQVTPDRYYDLLLLDWSMPEMDGLQVAEEMAERFKGPELPTMVLVSAYGNEILREQAGKRGFSGYITKPVTTPQLYNALQAALQHQPLELAPNHEDEVAQKNMLAKLHGLTLLVVDDHDINRQVLRQLLEHAGLRVLEAGSGREALMVLEEQGETIAGVLMDMQMPELDGMATTRIIRQHKEFAGLPVIAVSANILPADRHACLEAGMDDFVAKPIEMEEMVEKLYGLIKHL